MKKLFSLLMVFVLLLQIPIVMAEVDISGLSYEELVSLVNEAQLQMMKTEKWQEVEVPAGTYLIGRDIPAGHWTIKVVPAFGKSIDLYWSDVVNENGQGVPRRGGSFYTTEEIVSENFVFGAEGRVQSVSWELRDGHYLCIDGGSAIFTPFAGNSFTFK